MVKNRTIAALFVDERGPYVSEPDVEIWGITKDARKYNGPHPVIAHPPCSTWCQLAPMNQSIYGHRIGDDDGCFESALFSVRKYGGVLEHPANSYAWTVFNLPVPPSSGSWVRDIFGGWTCCVYQGHYKNEAAKGTWLYACHATILPSLRWGKANGKSVVSWCNNHGTKHDNRKRISKREASRTPLEFKDILLNIARSSAVNQFNTEVKEYQESTIKAFWFIGQR